MDTPYTLPWFKKEIEPQLLDAGFRLVYSSFGEGDLGKLERAEFESEQLMGSFEFWSLGWLDIHVVRPVEGVEVLNVLLPATEETGKKQAVATFLSLL